MTKKDFLSLGRYKFLAKSVLKGGASLRRQMSNWDKWEGGETDNFKKQKWARKACRDDLEGKKKNHTKK